MKTSELIAKIGDVNVSVQFIDKCAIDLSWGDKKGTRITFGTDVRLLSDGYPELMGMIVWMDRDAVKAALDAEKARKGASS